MQPPLLQTDWLNQVTFDPESRQPHSESFTWHAVSPTGHRALWVRLALAAGPHGRFATVHACYLDADHPGLWQGVEQVDLSRMRMDPERAGIGIEACNIEAGASCGNLRNESGSLAWRVQWQDEYPGYAGLPARWLYRSSRTSPKLATPSPSMLLAGELEIYRGQGRHVPVQRVDLTGWRGVQRHSWGPCLPTRAAWVHCNVFSDAAPGTFFEAYAGPVVLAGLRRDLHLGRLVDPSGSQRFERWRSLWQAPDGVRPGEWTFTLSGDQATVRGRARGAPQPQALPSTAPAGAANSPHTFISLLAELSLEVTPHRGGPVRLLHSDRAILTVHQPEALGSLAVAAA